MAAFELQVLPATDEPGPDEPWILYRPLAGLAFVGNRAMAELTRSAAQGDREPGPARDFLEQIGFLGKDPPEPDPPPPAWRPATVVLLMTNDCQLRCTYCYAAAGSEPGEVLDPHVAEAVIAHVAAAARERGLDRFEVSLHGGGEPTRAWPALQACVRIARAQPIRAHVTMTSNGIWSRRQLGWITDNLDAVTISVDGTPGTQDQQRPFTSGRGSSPAVMRTLAELDRAGFPYAIRMTATAPWERLAGDVGVPVLADRLPGDPGRARLQHRPRWHPSPTPRGSRASAKLFGEAFAVASASGRQLTYSGARLGAAAGAHCIRPVRFADRDPPG